MADLNSLKFRTIFYPNGPRKICPLQPICRIWIVPNWLQTYSLLFRWVISTFHGYLSYWSVKLMNFKVNRAHKTNHLTMHTKVQCCLPCRYRQFFPRHDQELFLRSPYRLKYKLTQWINFFCNLAIPIWNLANIEYHKVKTKCKVVLIWNWNR